MNNPKGRYALPVIFLTVLLDLVSISILVPVLPALFADPRSAIHFHSVGLSVMNGYIVLGLLIGIWPLVQFFASPVIGELSDRYGRKKVMAISLAGVCLSHLLFSYGIIARSLTILFAARILGGVFGSNLAVAQAAIADITPEKDRAKNFGLIGAAYGVGFIVGPILGGLTSSHGIANFSGAITPFILAAILEIINVAAILAFLPETRELPAKPVVAVRSSWFAAISHLITAYSMKNLRAVFASNFFFQAGFAFFGTFLSVYLIHRFGFSEKGIGLYMAYGGLFIVLAQAVVTRYVAARFDEVSVLRWALFFGSLTILAYYLPKTIVGLLVIIPPLAIANGLAMANLPALVSRRVSQDKQGEILGINMSVQSLAYAIPPIVSGFLAAKLAPEAPVYIAGLIILVAWLIFILTVRHYRGDAATDLSQ